MNPSEELRRHAMECGQMANFLRNKENSAAWNSIAERYLRCAQWYDTRRSMADRLKNVRRQKGSRPQSDGLRAVKTTRPRPGESWPVHHTAVSAAAIIQKPPLQISCFTILIGPASQSRFERLTH
jgi:hypothetical protein